MNKAMFKTQIFLQLNEKDYKITYTNNKSINN